MTKKRDCMQRLYTGISDLHYSTNPNSFTRRSVYPLSDPERVGGEDGDTKISKPPKLHIQLITPNGEKKGKKSTVL